MSRFVVLGTARTGTSLVCSLLDSHPDVTCPGEVFVLGRGRLPVLERKGLGMRETYVKWLRGGPLRQLRHALGPARAGAVADYLTDFFTGSEVSARGFKLLVTQTLQLPGIVPWLQAHDVRVIRVARRNLLKTWVSREVKRRTRRATARDAVPLTTVRADVEAMLAKLAWMEDEQRAVDELLAGQPSLRVVYETLQADLEGESRRMLRFLGVDAGVPVSTPYVKTNPECLADVVENYAEVAAALAGTPWERHLDAAGGSAADAAAGRSPSGAPRGATP